jgi:hypothetical protein
MGQKMLRVEHFFYHFYEDIYNIPRDIYMGRRVSVYIYIYILARVLKFENIENGNM